MTVRRGPGLRARLTAAFALGALLLSTVLAVASYRLSLDYLLRQREAAAVRQAVVNAAAVQAAITAGPVDLPAVLAGVREVVDAEPVLLVDGRAFGAGLVTPAEDLPEGLRAAVLDGRPVTMRYRSAGLPRLAVGVPLDGAAAYFEVGTLEELDRTLRVLSSSLAAVAAVTAALGAAVGLATSRRLLRPVREVAAAAAGIAGGDLDTRLEETADRDLAALTASFNAMVDALQARVERDARFAADVSHELRSPLTTLETALSVMEARRGDLPERAGRALDLLAAEVRRFERLVEDLLAISRDDAEGPRLVLEEVRLVELARRSLAAVGREDLPVQADADGQQALVCVDKRRLEQVVRNLLDNARDHGGGVLAVSVEADPADVRLVVDDAGPGVPDEDKQRVFERFHRGSASGRRGRGRGVGLGLALVRGHVAAHGGRVWVEDRPGGSGARFVVELPRVRL